MAHSHPDPAADASSAEESAQPPRIRAYWYSQAEAARVLRVSDAALRRRIAGGSVTAIRSGRSWRILLPGEPFPASSEPEPAAPTEPVREVTKGSLESFEPLVGLVRDLQRQALALAGQIGYLQNELSRTQGQLESLREEASNHPPTAKPAMAVDQREHQAALDEIGRLRATLQERDVAAATPSNRRGWAFWRWR